MKKLLRITIMDRFGPTNHFKPYTYVVNRKFCEQWNIQFEGRTHSDLKRDLIDACTKFGIKLISIE